MTARHLSTAAVLFTALLAARPLFAADQPEISPQELQKVLADMAKAHDDKTKLSLYASLPWQGVEKPMQHFYSNMGEKQKELLKDLESWAKAHKVDLTYHYGDDINGQAEKILDARQEKLVRGDSKADFPRDTIMQMYSDYEWQISVIQALLPRVRDPGLKAYLQKSLQVHQEGSDEALSLLKRYQFH